MCRSFKKDLQSLESLYSFVTTPGFVLIHPEKLRFENKKTKLINSRKLDLTFGFLFIRDHARIQTWNLLSRNQVRYSVAPRGLLKWVQI